MKAALFALLILAGVLLVPFEARATSCVVPELESSLDRATLVFTGRATVRSETGHQTLAEMAVDRVFKGSAPRKLVVSGGGMAGATFENGKRYLVFARVDPDGQVFAHLCGGTQALPSDWVKRLGSGSAPTASGKPVAAEPEAGAAPDPATDPNAPAAPASATPEAPVGDPGTPEAAAPPTAPAPAPSVTPPPSGGCGSCGVAAPARSPEVLPWLVLFAAFAGRRRRAHDPDATCQPARALAGGITPRRAESRLPRAVK